MIPIKTGAFNRRMTFQRRGQSIDAFGGQTVTWADAFQAWVRIEPLSVNERLLANQMRVDVSHKIVTRYRPELANPADVGALRGVYAGRIFNLAGSVNINERNTIVEITATEGLNNG